MIRINLYQGGQKKGRRAPAPPISVGSTVNNVVFLLVMSLLIAGTAVGNYLYYNKLTTKSSEIKAEKAEADVRYNRLSQIKASFEEREKQRNLFKKRVDVIDDLRAKQSGPKDLLASLGDAVNRTDAVWLVSMNDDGAAITLKGTALSIHAVANLMNNLQKSGAFKTVDIRTSAQDEAVKDMQAFNFELVCQREAPKAPPSATPAPKTRS